MKKLTIEQVSQLSAKGPGEIVSGACAGLAGAGVLAMTLKIASNLHPVAKGIYMGAAVGCAAWGLYTLK